MLHMPSLLFSVTVVVLTVSGILLVIRAGEKGSEHTGIWTLGNLAIALGTMLTATRGILPAYMSMIVGNMAVVIGVSLLVVSLRRIFAKPVPWIGLTAVWTVGLLAFMHFTWIDESVPARIVIISTLIGGISVWGVVSVLPLKKAIRNSQILLVFLFGLFAVFSAFRLVDALLAPPISNLLQAGGVQWVTILIYMAILIGLSMGYLWLLNQRLTEFLLHSNALLRRSNADLDVFAHVLSHDLRSPLTAAQLYLGGVPELAGPSADPALKTVLDKVAAAHRRMNEMIEGVLQLATIEGQNQNLGMVVECGEALERALANLEAEITATGAKIRSDPMPSLRADPVGLSRLFQNLIGNAIKFRRPETPPVIDVSAAREPSGWHFQVRDNGTGIAPEDRDTVFGLFNRSTNNKSIPGTGIGLAECRRIVARHGGRIWVESAANGGSDFHFTIPDIPTDS